MPPCAGRAGQSYKENAINLEPELLPFVSVRPTGAVAYTKCAGF